MLFIVAVSRFMGFLELKKWFSSGGVLGAAKFRVFLLSDKNDRRYVSVRVACGFNLVKKIFPDAWIANEKGAAEGAS